MSAARRSSWLTNRLVNPVLRPVLRGPLGRWFGRHLAVVRYRGRRSGNQCELVAQYARDRSTVWIVPGSPERKTWWRNLREPAEIDFDAAGRNRVALIADPSGGAMFLYQLEERATADPGIAAATTTSSFGPRPQAADGGGGPNVSVSASMSYGTGWGSVYPRMPYRPYGPVPY